MTGSPHPDLLATARPIRVLLLEDSRYDVELLRASLDTAFPGATLHHVQDEGAFESALRDGSHDVILSDYELPGYSGLQALHTARTLAPQTPFVFVSGVIGEDNAVELMKQGATDYVSKGRLKRLPPVIERALREAEERTARGRAEARLRDADELFTRVLDALPDYAVIVLDAQARILTWHPAAAELFGHPLPGPIGQPMATLFTEEDRAAGVPEQELRQAIASGKSSGHRWMQQAGGGRFFAEGVVAPLRDARGALRGYAKVVHDATEAHVAAAALRSAKEAAERANEAKDRFLAVLSHELRTPLAPIATAAQALQRALEPPPHLAELLPMITRNVALEARLIDDLLDMTAISAGKMVLRRELVDLQALLTVVLRMLEEEIAARGIELRVELQATSARVLGDAARLQQVLWNVVRNAVKFSAPGSRVELSTVERGAALVFVCKDQGIGIAPDALPRIFTPFTQADDQIVRRYGGLGLGLSIAKALVDEHGGELHAASEGPGQGALFTLTLPLVTAAESPAPAPTEAAPDAGGRRLLLVEDNLDAGFALVAAFELMGYCVHHAKTCAEALALARTGEHDVIVSDLGLPDGSGLDIGRALRGRTPLIALSGYGRPEDIRQSLAAGFAAHLVKPIGADELHAAIEGVLGGTPAD